MIKIAIGEKQYELPTTLFDITLQQRIDFDNQYGKGLREQLKKIAGMKDGLDREIEFTTYHSELAIKTLSFFGAIDLTMLESQVELTDIFHFYHSTVKSIGDDVDFSNTEAVLQQEFHWNDATWHIAPPELHHESAMTFAEFLDAKQWIKNLYELGNDKYEALLMLCCVYFRKKDEKYTDDLIKVNGERYNLLKSVPLHYAMQVGFFLSASMDTYMPIFHSSTQMANQEALN